MSIKSVNLGSVRHSPGQRFHESYREKTQAMVYFTGCEESVNFMSLFVIKKSKTDWTPEKGRDDPKSSTTRKLQSISASVNNTKLSAKLDNKSAV